MEDADVINADVHKFDNFIWYGADTDFERIDDTIRISVGIEDAKDLIQDFTEAVESLKED